MTQFGLHFQKDYLADLWGKKNELHGAKDEHRE